jgi:hypothetical protein
VPKKIDITKFCALFLLVTIVCYQYPAKGTAGLGEVVLRTPDGKSFGGDARPSEADILGHNKFLKYGFYDNDRSGRYIVGQVKTGEFKIYDRVSDETISFASKQRICEHVKAKGWKFNSNLNDLEMRELINIVSPFFGHLDFFIILFSIYTVLPILLLLLIFTRFNNQLPLSQRLDVILSDSPSFKLLAIGSSVFLNCKLFNNYASDINFILVCIFWLPLMQYLAWKLAVFISSKLMNLKKIPKDSNPTAYLKTSVFLVALMLFLSFTVGSCQAPDTSIQYFYCD